MFNLQTAIAAAKANNLFNYKKAWVMDGTETYIAPAVINGKLGIMHGTFVNPKRTTLLADHSEQCGSVEGVESFVEQIIADLRPMVATGKKDATILLAWEQFKTIFQQAKIHFA